MAEQPMSPILLHYFKRPNAAARWKRWLVSVALVLPLGWLTAGWFQGDRGRLRYSRGPLAEVHATWDDQCAACHVAFTPINHSASAGLLFGGFHVGEALCRKCHAEPPHSPFQLAAEVRICADCHREHRGRDASLTRLPDSECVRCHADLKDHVQPSRPPHFADVRRFARNEHPEFRIRRDQATDPARVNFNHQVHLTPGMGGGRPRPSAGIPFTLAQIPPPERDRYRRLGQAQADDAENVVQLTCASCHRLGTAPPYESRAYMQPITYENQCRACHPLTVEEAAGKRAWTVPHGWQPGTLHEFLAGVLVARYLTGQPTILAEPFVAPRPIPGKPLDQKAETARDFIQSQLAVAETRLYVGYQTCGECHQFTTPQGIVTPAEIKPGAVPKFAVQPAGMPSVWLTHARFDHAAHRSMTCVECHEAAEKSVSSRDVLFAGDGDLPSMSQAGRSAHGLYRVSQVPPCQPVNSDAASLGMVHMIVAGISPHSSKRGTLSATPAKAMGPMGRVRIVPFTRSWTDGDTKTDMPTVLVTDSMRLARLTVRPKGPYWRRRSLPVLPTRAGPLFRPIPIASDPPMVVCQRAFKSGSWASIARAARQPRIAWSGCWNGAFHIARMPSPM